jgi:hypothetical protein
VRGRQFAPLLKLKKMNALEANKDYLDLYQGALSEYVTLPANATFRDIQAVVATNYTIGYQHHIKVGAKNVIAERKYTWTGRIAKTQYLHIWVVDNFDNKKVIEYWREQKDGTFRTI